MIYLNADCMNQETGLPSFPDKHFDLAIVDPPYGLGSKLVDGGTWSRKWQGKGSEWDRIPDADYFTELIRVSKQWVVWGGNYFAEFLPSFRHFIAWHKPYMDGMHSMSNVELAVTSFDTNARFISINKDSNERIHVTQKPKALYRWLLKNYAKQGDLILDTHVGSASSLIAFEEMGFDYVGFELDTDYYRESTERIQRFRSQGKLFTGAEIFEASKPPNTLF